MKKIFFALLGLCLSTFAFAQTQNLNNFNLENVNTLSINDPGPSEGIRWLGTSAFWSLDVTPLDRSNADGNFNIYGTANNIVLWRPLLLKSNLNVVGSGNHYIQNGNVGIGTISPSAKLHVSSMNSGDAIFRLEADLDNNNEADNSRLEIMQDGGSLGAYIGFNNDWGGVAADNLFRIGSRYSGVDNFNRLVIKTDNGNVGIGTASPLERLSIQGNMRITGETVSTHSNLLFYRGDGAKFTSIGQADLSVGNSTFDFHHHNGNDFRFLVNDSERLRIKGNGNVGIGTSSPDTKLDVQGTGKTEIQVKSNTSGAANFIVNTATNYGGISYKNNGTEYWYIGNNGTGSADMTFFTGTNSRTERLRITGSGDAIFQGDIETKKVKVTQNPGNWPDYVFTPDYDLRSLNEVETYIKTNQHLPEVPSAKEVDKNGLDLGKMDATLLKKVEELTLYMIELNKTVKAQGEKIKKLEKENQTLKSK